MLMLDLAVASSPSVTSQRSRTRAPVLRVALPDGDQGQLPGVLWPAALAGQLAADAGNDGRGFGALLEVAQIGRKDADALLEAWEHPLGACRRPFGRQDFALMFLGDPVAVVTSASTVSANVIDDLHRRNVVELARLCRHPDHPHALRAMLRLWRCYMAQRWPYWSVTACVAYGLPGTPGDLYRFDGFTRLRVCGTSGGGGTWTSRKPQVNALADGRKTLWAWRYDTADGRPPVPPDEQR